MDWFVELQKLLPKHGLSRLVGALAEQSTRQGVLAPIARLAIDRFAATYDVDLRDALRTQLTDYDSFNDFFTRALADGARPIAADADLLVSPCDGQLGQCGSIDGGTLVQAKGHRYRVADLLGDAHLARAYDGGYFVTIYLAPRDYHRVHAPEAGRLRTARYIPGELFSVNGRTEAGVPGLFARNERLVCLLDTAHGEIALTMVGALIVAGIRTVWQQGSRPDSYDARTPPDLGRGAELGHFRLGSTVVLCLPAARWTLDRELQVGSAVRMGAPLLRRLTPG